MRSIILKVFAVAVWAWALFMWVAIIGSATFSAPRPLLPDFFFFLGAGYFFALIGAVFIRNRKGFYFLGAIAHALLAAEILYMLWAACADLRGDPVAWQVKDIVYVFGWRLGLLAFIYLLPSLVWFFLWANWCEISFLPVLKAFAVVASGYGIIMWAISGPMAGAVDPITPFISRIFLFMEPFYFLLLVWAGFTQSRKKFCVGLIAAALILMAEFLFILGAMIYGASHDPYANGFVDRIVPFVLGLSMSFVLFYAVFFLSFWAWGLLCVRWLIPSWFKKIDIPPKLG